VTGARGGDGRVRAIMQHKLSHYGRGGLRPVSAISYITQIRYFYETGRDVLWVTFFRRPYWCFAAPPVMRLRDRSQFRARAG
jgi:hypothetical protein